MKVIAILCLFWSLVLSTASASVTKPQLTLPLLHAVDSVVKDSTEDSVDVKFGPGGIIRRMNHPHVFVLTELEHTHQHPYHEPFTLIDFNRVTGFFLGLGSNSMMDFGPHDELGLNGSFGYGFASKRWEYQLATEIRLPLVAASTLLKDTTKHHIYTPPTLAFGGEIHNITSTDDAWRAGRLENAAYAFFAREDFRDYYKLAGWQGYLAFRPVRNYELKLEWRSDHYESLPQNVFYGRFGGNKVLPPNPPVSEGRMNSLVLTSEREGVHTRIHKMANLFGDTVSVEQLAGISSMLQLEFGHMPASDFGFNRFTLDARHFMPLFNGLNFDTRFRFEAETGDPLPQKLSYLGGPGTLAALYRKSLVGNRMLLLNTELRLNLSALTSYFHSPDLDLVVYNDFAKLGIATQDQSILKGFGFGSSNILYNVGVGLGWTNGIQVGAIWRTDVVESPRVMFRLQRPF